MLTLILVRHGHSECNVDGLIQAQRAVETFAAVP